MTLQPEQDGRLQCLECGRWYRLLPPHLGRVHEMSAAEYRKAHQLPRKLGLRASDLAEQARNQGRVRYTQRPDIRAHMAAGRTTIDRTNVVAGTRASAGYEMVRAAHRAGGQGAKAAHRRRADQAAQALGFTDLDAYLDAREEVPHARAARELGISRQAIRRYRAARTTKQEQ